MSLNKDGFEGGKILTIKEQVELRRISREKENAVPAKRTRKPRAEKTDIGEGVPETPAEE